jgi:hypothetical protein
MYSRYLLLFLVVFALFHRSCYSYVHCWKQSGSDCGTDCTGTPKCGGKTCGNVDNMCYCDCYAGHCETSALGYKWNGGILKEDGSYALNGTKGDGRAYKC